MRQAEETDNGILAAVAPNQATELAGTEVRMTDLVLTI